MRQVPFEDVARQVGVDIQFDPGSTGEFYFCEIVGGGVALFDYDNDGDLDLYLAQAFELPVNSTQQTDRLYRNECARDANGVVTLRFSDVTSESQIRASGYGMGVATGDFDNDGNIDLYLANFGSNQLWRNKGDGTFEDVTSVAAVDDNCWSTSASFVDYDRDGWLDLFVANYVNFDLGSHKPCVDPRGFRDYCGPKAYDPVPDRLFRNQGDGTFVDVSAETRIVSAYGAGLGVIATDANHDGWMDLYVANDQDQNQLWINEKGDGFVNTAMLAGCALNSDGKAESGMGVDAGDFDGDGDEDLFVTHLATETNTLYLSVGGGSFEDATRIVGLGLPSWKYTGFGTGWVDYDNDSWLDLFVANGSVNAGEVRESDEHRDRYRQRNLLFRNKGGVRFEDVSAHAGPALAFSEVSRAAAFGDVDNDGDTDIVVSNIWGPTRILLNRVGNRSDWVGLRLVSDQRDALGARVEVRLSDGRSILRIVRTDGSYVSARDPRVLCGLGDNASVESVQVHWPRGAVEEFHGIPSNSWTTLTRGLGVEVGR